MAQKQYSFDFVLNAVLNGGFSGTFTKAQQEFVRLGNEIKNLQAIQRDIAAYQKQAAAVENTSGKLENLRRQYELVNRQISETTGSTTALEREKLKLEQRISSTEAALEKQRKKLEETKDHLDAAGVSTDDLAAKDAALTEKIKELTEEQKKAAEGAVGFRDKGVEAIEAVGSAIATAGIAEAVRGIADAYEECVGVAGDFEQAMSAVEAISEANESEMAALKAEAKDLGATTIHTAQQSAKGMEYMAMAGWKAMEMLSGMRGMTTLAAAAGEDLAQTSDIVTDNLSAFNMKASETAHFADVLAATAANSNTKIAIMGETFKNSSSVAGTLKYSIEDVAVMVGLMANNAVKGTRAGTALRNILNGLLGGVTLTSQAFGELEYSSVNYDGTMKSLMETVEDLRGYFNQMTEAEKVMNAQNIAGLRGYNGLLAILKATDEDFQSLYDSIYNCSGAAERMAAVKLDNLNGDITIMNSAMEALQSTIGELFNPELRELAKTGTEGLNLVNEFIQENPAMVKGIMAGGTAMFLFTNAIVGANAAIKVFKVLKAAELFAAWTGPAFAVAGGIAAITAGVVAADSAIKDEVSDLKNLVDVHRDALQTYRDSTAAIDGEAESTIGLLNSLRELSGQSEKTAADQAQIAEICNRLSTTVPDLSLSYDAQTDSLTGLTESLDSYIESLYQAQRQERDVARLVELRSSIEETSAALEEAKEKAEEYEDELYRMAHEGSDVFWIQQELTAYQIKVAELTALLEDEEAEYARLTDSVNEYTNTQEDAAAGEDAVQETLEATRRQVQELADAYAEAYSEAKESFEGQFGLFDKAKADAEATVEAAQKALDSQLKYWQDYAANIESLKEVSAEDLDITQENYDALMNYVRSGTPEAAGLAADMVREIDKGNTQALTDLANTLGEISESQAQAAQDVAEWTTGLTEQMDQLISDMEEGLEALDLSEEAKEYGRETVQGYVDAVEGMLGPVRNAYANVALAARLALAPAYSDSAYWANGLGSISNIAATSSEWDGSYWTVPGHAGGTASAPPGWAWVGEEGPELMRMRGGEQILPNGVSEQLAEDYEAYNRYTSAKSIQQARPLSVIETTSSGAAKVEMHFHIEAGASPDTVDAWQSYVGSGELKATILEVMEDAEADARRRALT